MLTWIKAWQALPSWRPDAQFHTWVYRIAANVVTDALRDLANWLYRQLEQEYDYLTSDEAVDETLIVGGYTFTEEGRRFG